MEERKYSEMRSVKLTDAEIRSYSLELARLVAEASRVDAEKKSVAAEYTATLKDLKKDIGEISIKINQGYEMRNVAVIASYNWEAGTKSVARADNGDILDIGVPIPMHERNLHLPGTDEALAKEMAGAATGKKKPRKPYLIKKDGAATDKEPGSE